MSRLATGGKALLGIGTLLLILGFTDVVSVAPTSAAGLLVLGAVLVAVSRTGFSVSGVTPTIGLDRQDIVSATDWSRIGKYTFRRSFGVALAASGGVLFVLAVALQDYSLAGLWLAVTLAGLVVVAISWRYAHEIAADHTRTVSVRVPDMFSAHSFHIELRQQAEDLGYRLTANGSPTESGTTSAVDEEVFHAKGGFKARKRPIDESRTLVPELDDPYLGRILTVTTLGVFALFLGLTLFSAGGEIVDGAQLLGVPLVFAGIVVIGYDYVTRTREWGELYCVEEGTIYASRITKYEDDVLDAMDRGAEPTISSPATGAVLSVTVGAKCTSLYDEDALEADFEALVDAVDDAIENHQFSVTGEGDGSTVLTHTEPGAETAD